MSPAAAAQPQSSAVCKAQTPAAPIGAPPASRSLILMNKCCEAGTLVRHLSVRRTGFGRCATNDPSRPVRRRRGDMHRVANPGEAVT